MIKKFGTVTITEDNVVVSGFVFEGGDPENDAVKWAIARIKSAQHRVQRMGLLARIGQWFGAIAHR